ncbi:MAG: hypothetical protein RIT81_12305 [Deltaproteobacteria bacterium]
MPRPRRPTLASARLRVLLTASLLTCACDLTCAPSASAAPELLIFGGGWGPEGTQASIEAHTRALHRAMPKARVLFAAPSAEARAVQIPAAKKDHAATVLGLVFDRGRDLHVDYRPAKIERHAAATSEALLSALDALPSNRAAIVFGAGHGTKATATEPALLELWGPDDRVSAQQLVEALGERKAPTAFVLGQCHSGAFADVAFEDADPTKPVANVPRCVLAAVPHDREAAGCTPDVDDDSAPAYLAQFARGISKRRADFDRDGHVSLAEAHAFAAIHDPTVDVPVRSSEVYVERLLGTAMPTAATLDEALAKGATSAERAVLTQVLPEPLRDAEPERVREALASIDERLDISERELEAALDTRDKLRRSVLDAVLLRWPELVNPYHAKSRALLAGDAKPVVATIEAHKDYPRLLKQNQVVRELDDVLFDLEKRGARIERWIRTATHVAARRIIDKRKDGAKAALARLEACGQQRL